MPPVVVSCQFPDDGNTQTFNVTLAKAIYEAVGFPFQKTSLPHMLMTFAEPNGVDIYVIAHPARMQEAGTALRNKIQWIGLTYPTVQQANFRFTLIESANNIPAQIKVFPWQEEIKSRFAFFMQTNASIPQINDSITSLKNSFPNEDHSFIDAHLVNYLCENGTIAFYNEALRICNSYDGHVYWRIHRSAVLEKIADAHARMGRHEEAVACYQNSLNCLTPIYSPSALKIKEITQSLAKALNSQGETILAITQFENVYDATKKWWGEHHQENLNVLVTLGGLYDSLGNLHDAIRFYEAAKQIHEKNNNTENENYIGLIAYKAEALFEWEHFGEALPIFIDCYTRYKRINNAHPYCAAVLSFMMLCYETLGNRRSAFICYREIIERLTHANLGRVYHIQVLCKLGDFCLQLNQLQLAREHFKNANHLRLEEPTETHEDIEAKLKQIEERLEETMTEDSRMTVTPTYMNQLAVARQLNNQSPHSSASFNFNYHS